jgi:hypothetical protein
VCNQMAGEQRPSRWGRSFLTLEMAGWQASEKGSAILLSAFRFGGGQLELDKSSMARGLLALV